MGGSGRGGTFIGPWTETEQRKIDQAREKERQRLDENINNYLNSLLARFNSREIDETNEKLDQLIEILGENIEVEKTLFGGSVAKHTDVNGISDVDALVILDPAEYEAKTPQQLLNTFYSILDRKVPRNNVLDIEQGKQAITLEYDDLQIQLLPAIQSGERVSIGSPDSKKWIDINPKVFQHALSNSNKKMDFNLVPTIKLFKSINEGLPKQKQLNGYHIEALAINSIQKYKGPKTTKALLLNLLDYASENILKPIKDTTGQSSKVDEYLGKPNSVERKNISQTLTSMRRRLGNATSISQWKAVFEDEL